MYIKMILNEDFSVEKGDVLEIEQSKTHSREPEKDKYIVKINGVKIDATSQP